MTPKAPTPYVEQRQPNSHFRRIGERDGRDGECPDGNEVEQRVWCEKAPEHYPEGPTGDLWWRAYWRLTGPSATDKCGRNEMAVRDLAAG